MSIQSIGYTLSKKINLVNSLFPRSSLMTCCNIAISFGSSVILLSLKSKIFKFTTSSQNSGGITYKLRCFMHLDIHSPLDVVD